MDRCEAAAALQAWFMAINHRLARPTDPVPIEVLAQDYGRAISTPENIDEASHLFNWEQLIILTDVVARNVPSSPDSPSASS